MRFISIGFDCFSFKKGREIQKTQRVCYFVTQGAVLYLPPCILLFDQMRMEVQKMSLLKANMYHEGPKKLKNFEKKFKMN